MTDLNNILYNISECQRIIEENNKALDGLESKRQWYLNHSKQLTEIMNDYIKQLKELKGV